MDLCEKRGRKRKVGGRRLGHDDDNEGRANGRARYPRVLPVPYEKRSAFVFLRLDSRKQNEEPDRTVLFSLARSLGKRPNVLCLLNEHKIDVD